MNIFTAVKYFCILHGRVCVMRHKYAIGTAVAIDLVFDFRASVKKSNSEESWTGLMYLTCNIYSYSAKKENSR